MKKVLAILCFAVCVSAQIIGVSHRQVTASAPPSPLTLDPTAPNTAIPYVSGGGATGATIAPTGPNEAIIVTVWNSGTLTPPTVDGAAMTAGPTHSVTYGACTSSTTFSIFIKGGISAGSHVIAVNSTSDTFGRITVYNNASATQPDATAAYIAGTTDGSGNATLPITTVADNAAVVGYYVAAVNLNNSPSSNGTRQGGDAIGCNTTTWRSTSNVTPAGGFSLNANTTGLGGLAYEAIGISVKPQ